MNQAIDFFNQGARFRADGRDEEAVECFERAVVLSRGHPQFLYALGPALEAVGRHWEAVGIMKSAVKVAPSASGLTALAILLLRDGNAAEATDFAQRAIALDPKLAPARIVLADALNDLGRGEEAQEQVLLAHGLDPQSQDAYAMTRANRLQFSGRLAEAAEAFEEVLRIDPAKGDAYFGLVACKGGQADRALVERMQSALSHEALTPRSHSMIHYALGKALDEIGDPGRAVVHFDEANRLLREARPGSFDAAGFVGQIDSTIAMYSAEFIRTNRPLGSESELPIFVVGMMRSGTTLAEQILSSHPDIGAAGEQGFWTRHESNIVDRNTHSIDGPLLSEYSQAYCHMLAKMAPTCKRVTDKNPANFLALGLIRTAFPKARIIHMRRHPVDTCLSIYMTPVNRPPEFSLDRGNIALAYRQYLRLMDHWRNVLPAEFFLEVDYEELVAHSGSVARRMVEFCGLEWNEACLHPESNASRVDTPSFWQVRRPMHSESVGRWRRYEPWLGAFRDLLD